MPACPPKGSEPQGGCTSCSHRVWRDTPSTEAACDPDKAGGSFLVPTQRGADLWARLSRLCERIFSFNTFRK